MIKNLTKWYLLEVIVVFATRGQGTFQNLNFEAARNVPNPGALVATTNALPGWSAFSGTNQLYQIYVFTPQSSHRKRMETAENKDFLTTLNAMGRSVAVKPPVAFQKTNKINGFVHVSYGTALYSLHRVRHPLHW